VKLNWRREILTVEPGADVQVLDTDPLRDDARWVVVNYDRLARHQDDLLVRRFDVVIVDEAHAIKNDSVRSKRTLELLGVQKGAAAGEGPAAVYLLTGTPMTNRPRDLFNLLKAVKHPLSNSFYAYAKRYCAAHSNGFGLDTNGASNLEELSQVMAGVMLRRMKSEALDLPEKVRTWMPLDVPTARVGGAERRALDYLTDHPARSGPTWITFLGLLNKARHALAITKARATADFVTDCVEAGQKVVVFTAYTGVVDTLLERFGPTAVSFTGADWAVVRERAVQLFQNDDAVRVFVGIIHAAGTGITLTAGSHVVFNDLDWVPANHWQASQAATTTSTATSAPTIASPFLRWPTMRQIRS
jgi:SWI/SNF-related matrix-associated actin-dependent regulator 1 of chromatin subfamily A